MLGKSTRLIAALIGAIVALAVIALSVFNWMFEEEGVEQVYSISQHTKARSVLAVFAHPDDEQLVTGLLIRAAEDENTRTAAITATMGEAGTPLPQISRLQDLGWIRKAEALKNTWALGVEHHQVLDFPDGGVDQVPLTALVAAVTAQMLEYRPDLVVTFWPESGYSDHADHKRMGLAAEIAILQLRQSPQQGYAGPVYIAYILAPTRMMSRFAGEMGQRVVDNQPAANYAQDGEAWAKIRGWEIHASQRDYVQHAYGLPAWLVHRLYDKEHYYLIESSAIRPRDFAEDRTSS
jgi:LmbE family N-acetylglucosaminyl deacetylase